MPDERLELLQEANRRGLLSGEQKQLYDEAVRRGLIEPTPFETARAQSTTAPERRLPPDLAPYDDVRVPARVDVQPPSDPSFRRSFAGGVIQDPQTEIRHFAGQMFPNDPNAEQRFGHVNGDVVYVNDEGKLERVTGGGFSGRAGSVAAYLPEIVGGTVGSFNPTAPVASGAVGAAGGRAFKRIIGNLVYGEPQTSAGVAADIATEGALDAAGGLAAKGFTKLAGRRAVSGLGQLDEAAAASTRQRIADATGIELDLAQVANLQKLDDLKRWAANFPGEASQVIQAHDEAVAGQVDNAIRRLVNVVSETDDAARAGIRGINAAEAAIQGARTEVADRVGPLYRRAFEQGGEVDALPVVNLINEKLKLAKGSQAAALRKARSFLNAPGTTRKSAREAFEEGGTAAVREASQAGSQPVLDTSVRGLHAAKLALDEMLERRGTTALGRTTRRDIREIKDALLHQLSEASPAYDQARQMFAEQTRQLVDPLENSVVGVLSKIDDTRAATSAAKLFNNGNVTPQGIRAAKQAILKAEQADPELAGSWNGLVRQWLESRFNQASREIQTGEAINVAGKFRQRIFGRDQQKEAMRIAIGDDAQELFDITMEALGMAARVRTGGSATAFNQLVTEEMRSGGGSLTRAAARLTQPRQTLLESLDQGFLEDQAVRIAEALTDPAKVRQLRALKGIRPSAERAAIALGILSGVGAEAALSEFAETDRLPETYQQNQAQQLLDLAGTAQ